MEEKIQAIIEELDLHIRGAGDYDGVKARVNDYMEEFIVFLLTPETKVLDVGAGDCYAADYLQGKISYWEGINKGIDWDNNKDKYNLKNIDFHFLPYKDNSFDLVLAVNVLEHTYFPIVFLSEIARVSKKYVFLDFPLAVGDGGIAANEDNPDHYFMMTQRLWEKVFTKLKFKIEKKKITGGEVQYLLQTGG